MSAWDGKRIIDRVRERMAEAKARSQPPALNLDAIKVPDSLAVAILLFPGLLAERVAAYFIDTPKGEPLQLAASALAATLFALAVTLVVAFCLRRWFPPADFRGLKLQQIALTPMFIVSVTLVAIGTGFLWAYLESHDRLFLISPSDRISRRDVLSKSLEHATAKGYHARIVVADVGVFHGHIRYIDPASGGGLYVDNAVIELADERASVRMKAELQKCKAAECRIPIACVNVGKGALGAVFLPMNRVRSIEFRPALDTEKRKDKAGEIELKRYSCDLLASGPQASASGASAASP
jgi:hypothetical protein